MKLKLIQTAAVLACLLATGGLAQAQSKVPGPADYEQFGRFIASRNIFDPNRYPHTPGTRIIRHTPRTRGAPEPAFSFVGAITYEKGLFAFFDGNNPMYRKALQVSGKLGDFTLQQITLNGVTLVSDGKTNYLQVGYQMSQATDGTWGTPGVSEGFSNQTESSSPSATMESGGSSAAPASPPSSSGEVSDVIKRLMQLRQQENK